jgi:hypothetical protein
MTRQAFAVATRSEPSDLLQTCLQHYLNWLAGLTPSSRLPGSKVLLQNVVERTKDLLALVQSTPRALTPNAPDEILIDLSTEFLAIASSACSTYLDSLALLQCLADVVPEGACMPRAEIRELNQLISRVKQLQGTISSIQSAASVAH